MNKKLVGGIVGAIELGIGNQKYKYQKKLKCNNAVSGDVINSCVPIPVCSILLCAVLILFS